MSIITSMFTPSVSRSLSRSLSRGLMSCATMRGTGSSFAKYFKPAPQNFRKMPEVRIVSFEEMQKICQNNFDRRIKKIVSEKM